MGQLIYSMITSLDGYVHDENGDFDWARPDDAVHAYVNERTHSVGTYLYGRRMYETMRYWETAHTDPDQPAVGHAYARIWQAADKVVYSTTLPEVTTARTRLERTFDPAAVRALKESSELDLTIDGPELAAHAIRAGLVDVYELLVCPVSIGSGHPFFPKGHLDLELLDERSFPNGVVALRYGPRKG